MTIALALATRNARLQVILDDIDAGSSAGRMEFYDLPRPASGATITTETLIGTNVFTDPVGTITDAVLTFDNINDDISADADADIGWCRILDSDSNFVIDLDCGLTGSGAEIIFNTLTARIGGVIQVLSGSFTEGNA